MDETPGALRLALSLLLSADAELLGLVGPSLRVSLSEAAIGLAAGVPIGAVLAIGRFPGRGAVLVAVNALLGLPPVVAGLAVLPGSGSICCCRAPARSASSVCCPPPPPW